MELIKFLMDIVIIGLLGAGVYYAVRLEKQLRVLREGRAEMARYMADFTRNVDRAEAGIKVLKTESRTAGDDLEKLLDRARAMQDELQFVVAHADSLVEKVTKIGSQLTQITQPRAAQSFTPPGTERPPLRAVAPAVVPVPVEPVEAPRTRAERELLHALEQLHERNG